MSQPALPRVERAVTRALDDGRIPGAVVLVARDGAVVHRDARGVTDPGGRHPGQPRARPRPGGPRFAGNPLAGKGYYSGAAGLWGSSEDYLAFAGFLRDGRDATGRQLLSAQSLRQMTASQTGDLCPGLNGRAEAKGIGFGLAVTVVTDPAAAGLPVTAGAFGWDGVTTRRFWVDPAGWTLFMYVPDQGVQQEIEAAVADEAG